MINWRVQTCDYSLGWGNSFGLNGVLVCGQRYGHRLVTEEAYRQKTLLDCFSDVDENRTFGPKLPPYQSLAMESEADSAIRLLPRLRPRLILKGRGKWWAYSIRSEDWLIWNQTRDYQTRIDCSSAAIESNGYTDKLQVGNSNLLHLTIRSIRYIWILSFRFVPIVSSQCLSIIMGNYGSGKLLFRTFWPFIGSRQSLKLLVL